MLQHNDAPRQALLLEHNTTMFELLRRMFVMFQAEKRATVLLDEAEFFTARFNDAPTAAADVARVSAKQTSALAPPNAGSDDGFNRALRRAKRKRNGTLFNKRRFTPTMCLSATPMIVLPGID